MISLEGFITYYETQKSFMNYFYGVDDLAIIVHYVFVYSISLFQFSVIMFQKDKHSQHLRV